MLAPVASHTRLLRLSPGHETQVRRSAPGSPVQRCVTALDTSPFRAQLSVPEGVFCELVSHATGSLAMSHHDSTGSFLRAFLCKTSHAHVFSFTSLSLANNLFRQSGPRPLLLHCSCRLKDRTHHALRFFTLERSHKFTTSRQHRMALLFKASQSFSTPAQSL